MEKERIADYLSSSEGQKQLFEALNRRNERIEECIKDIQEKTHSGTQTP